MIGMDIYLITGASSEIGIAYIQKMDKKYTESKQNGLIYGTYYSNPMILEEVKEQLKSIQLVPIRCDLSDKHSVDELVRFIEKDGNIPTHLAHLAAQKFEYMRIKEFDWEITQKELEIEVHSFARICKWLLPIMSRKHYGKIVALLTAYTLGTPPKYMSDYIIAKYALLGFVKAAASEYSGKGITINAVSPNMIETKFVSNIDARMVEMNAQRCAMKRNVTKDEVIDAMFFLLSDGSSYINGINLNLTGGDLM